MRGALPYRGVSEHWFGPRSADEGQPWKFRAACREADMDLFFPEGRGRSTDVALQAARAKAVCAGCPVRAECLAYATARGERWGIWGGVDFQEPARARKRADSHNLDAAVQRSAA